jgi:hypothetical protein
LFGHQQRGGDFAGAASWTPIRAMWPPIATALWIGAGCRGLLPR